MRPVPAASCFYEVQFLLVSHFVEIFILRLGQLKIPLMVYRHGFHGFQTRS